MNDALARALEALLALPSRFTALEAEVRGLRAEVAALRPAAPPALVSVPKAAERLGMSEATVRRRIRAGSLRSVKVGRSLRVDLSALRAPSEAEVEAEVQRLRTVGH